MLVVASRFRHGRTEGGGEDHVMVAREDGLERFAHPAANHFRRAQFFRGAVTPGIQAGPDGGVVSRAATVEPRRVDAGGGGTTEDGVGRGRFGAGLRGGTGQACNHDQRTQTS